MAQSRKLNRSSRAKKLLADATPHAFLKAYLRGDSDVADEALLLRSQPDRKLLLIDIANLLDEGAISRFRRRWHGRIRPELTQDLVQIRNDLREVWRHPDFLPSGGLLDKWLRWAPSADHLQAYRTLGLPHMALEAGVYVPFRCSVKAGRLVPDFMSLRAMLVQGVFENWRHFKFCSNPGCPAPYFVAKRRDQTVCDAGDCKAEKQRQRARNWWKENRSREAIKNRPQKEGAGHGTRKAR